MIKLCTFKSALRNRHMKADERWSEHTRRLPPLAVGDAVRIQSQIDAHPKRWDKTGRIIEVRQYDQYGIRVDGSGRVTLRNPTTLRHYTPAVSERPRPHLLTEDLPLLGHPPAPPRMTSERHTEPAPDTVQNSRMTSERHAEPAPDDGQGYSPPRSDSRTPLSPRAGIRESPTGLPRPGRSSPPAPATDAATLPTSPRRTESPPPPPDAMELRPVTPASSIGAPIALAGRRNGFKTTSIDRRRRAAVLV